MTKTGYKNLFIALLLLAFTSQSFAALMMPCQFAPQSSNSMDMGDMDMGDMAGMDHAGMDHSSMSHPDKTHSASTSDCCKTVGHCSSGGCFLAFFSQTFDLPLLALHRDVNVSYSSAIPEHFASSLFRPPIFC